MSFAGVCTHEGEGLILTGQSMIKGWPPKAYVTAWPAALHWLLALPWKGHNWWF